MTKPNNLAIILGFLGIGLFASGYSPVPHGLPASSFKTFVLEEHK